MSSVPNRPVTLYSAAGAIAAPGDDNFAVLSGSGALAMTLPLPDHDGQSLTIQDVGTAHAHTVTTPATGVNGASHVLTFAATGGPNYAYLVAYNGSWWLQAQLGITVS